MSGAGIPRAEVPLGPPREAFAESGLSACEVARRVGVGQTYVRRTVGRLGLYAYRTLADGTRRRHVTRNLSVSYDRAVALVRAMDRDPVEFGL